MRREKGLHLHVCRPADLGDCTNNGISARFDKFTLVGWVDESERDGQVRQVDEEARVFEPTADAPAVLVKVRQFGSNRILSIVPVDEDAAALAEVPSWVMFGGNYADSSDSRIGNLYEKITGQRFYGAVAIHDRIEN